MNTTLGQERGKYREMESSGGNTSIAILQQGREDKMEVSETTLSLKKNGNRMKQAHIYNMFKDNISLIRVQESRQERTGKKKKKKRRYRLKYQDIYRERYRYRYRYIDIDI